MGTYYPSLDKRTGRFLALKKGQKPPKMLAMEERLGVLFEDDYKERYLNGSEGQVRFARRWEVSKNRIFDQNPNAARRAWSTMLGLSKRGTEPRMINEPKKDSCEGCGTARVPLERAHWIERSQGGMQGIWNLARLCPNCHTLLDRHDYSITEIVRKTLLARVVKNMVQKESDNASFPERLLSVCTAIISQRKK